MAKVELSEAAKQARRDYIRDWRRRNPEKTAEYTRRHWERKAEEAAADSDQKTGDR